MLCSILVEDKLKNFVDTVAVVEVESAAATVAVEDIDASVAVVDIADVVDTGQVLIS